MSSWDRDVDSSDGTRHRRLGTGRDNSKDLRCKDKGILFSTRAETGTGSEHDRDSTGRGENTGKRQAGVGGTSVVELRGGDGTRDNLSDERVILMVDSVSGGKGDESRVLTRVDTGEVGSEGKCEGVVENCKDDSWQGGKGINAGMVDREDSREGNDWGQGMTMWADIGKVGGEGNGQGWCMMMWSDTGKADGEGNGWQHDQIQARWAEKAIAKVWQSIARAEVGSNWQMDGGVVKEQILLEAGKVVR
jgi:hypothetical protein